VEVNNNTCLCLQYCQARGAIQKDCNSDPGYSHQVTVSSRAPLNVLGQAFGIEGLQADCNEWYLLHGSDRKACEGVCRDGFQLGLAGSGATFKKGGKPKRLLYDWGIYCAEMITTADEYAQPSGAGKDHFTLVVCPVVGGLTHVVTGDTIDREALARELTHGPHHSVLGDSTKTLGKPSREMLVDEGSQILPQLVLTYRCKL